MDESEFEARAAAALEAIERALEGAGVEADFELKGGGMLEIEFDDGWRRAAADSTSAGTGRHGATRAAVKSCSKRSRSFSPGS